MAPYDSDDSLDDDQDYTETDVLLGYASKDPKDENISRLGGRPEWLDSHPPSYALAKCKSCAGPLVQLLQLHGDLPDRFPGHERRLYVLGCRRRGCRRKEGSVRAVRAMRVSAEAAREARERRAQQEQRREREEAERREKERKQEGLGEALFGVAKGDAFGANPFSTGAGGSTNPFSTGGASANPFAKTSGDGGAAAASPSGAGASNTPAAEPADKPARGDAAGDLPRTFAETLSLNNPQATAAKPTPPPPEPWPSEADLPAPYPVSYLAEAEYETLDPVAPAAPAQNVRVMADADEEGAGGRGKEDKDVFESTIDATFQKFADRLAQNPDQCIRYEFGGAPLLYSRADDVGRRLLQQSGSGSLPRCGGCGGARVFEVQLTPQAIVELEGDGGEEALEGMDWGTIIVGVCERDCMPPGTGEGEAGYVEEWVGVQWEELTARR